MSTSRRAPWPAILALAAVASLAPEARAAEWTSFETEHFQVLSQVAEGPSREIIRRLHIYMQALPKLTNLPVRPGDTPTRIFLLEEPDFRRASVGRASISGYFLPRTFRNLIVVDASKDLLTSLETVQHEYVHFAIQNARLTDLPAFYEEGLAQLMQSFRYGGHRFNWGYFPAGQDIQAHSNSMSLRDLLAVEVGKGDYVDEERQTPFYARSLLLTHYCNLGDSEYLEPLKRMAGLIADGSAPDAAFDAEFGMPFEEMDRKLDMYLSRDAVSRYLSVPSGDVERDLEVRRTGLSAAEAEVRFGTLLLEAAPDDPGLAALFESHKADATAGDLASAGLAMTYERANRKREADAELDRIARLPDASVAALVMAGDALLERTQAEDFDLRLGANVMRRAASYYDAALAKEPQSLDALFARGLLELYLQDDLQSSARRLAAAYPASGQNADLALLLALHLDALGSEDSARRIIQSAACGVVSPAMRGLAEKKLGPLRCYR